MYLEVTAYVKEYSLNTFPIIIIYISVLFISKP